MLDNDEIWFKKWENYSLNFIERNKNFKTSKF